MARYKYQQLIKNILGSGHLTADDLYLLIKKKGINASLATIYRTLDFLVGTGECTKFSLDASKTYYEKNKGPHAHLIDKEKNIIVDVQFPLDSLQFPDGFIPNNAIINIFGSWKGQIPKIGLSLLQFVSINQPGENKVSSNTGYESVNQQSYTETEMEGQQNIQSKQKDTLEMSDIFTLKKIFREF